MTQPILATAPASAAELISLPHIEIIDPPNKLGQEIKTKNNPGTRHGNEFGATLTSCGDTPEKRSTSSPFFPMNKNVDIDRILKRIANS
jgi:hypothetical protein